MLPALEMLILDVFGKKRGLSIGGRRIAIYSLVYLLVYGLLWYIYLGIGFLVVAVFLILGLMWAFAALLMLIAGIVSPAPDSDYGRKLIKLSERFTRASAISGQEYGKFLVILEKAHRDNLVEPHQKKQIVESLHILILEKGRRISGLDYVELEKELFKPREAVFFKKEAETILGDYEKLREKVRDHGLDVDK